MLVETHSFSLTLQKTCKPLPVSRWRTCARYSKHAVNQNQMGFTLFSFFFLFFFYYILAVRYVSTLRLWFEVFLNFVAKNKNGQHYGHQVRDTHSQCKRSRRFISVNINQILISMFVTGFLSASSFCEYLWSFDYRAPGTNRSMSLATNFAKTWLATDADYKFTHTSKILYTYIF